MKEGIHPKYQKCTVSCACGETFETRSILDTINVEICYKCHPFYTGRQKFVDTAGRIEKFTRKYKDFRAIDRNKGAMKRGKAPAPVKGEAPAEAEKTAEEKPTPQPEAASGTAEPTPPTTPPDS